MEIINAENLRIKNMYAISSQEIDQSRIPCIYKTLKNYRNRENNDNFLVIIHRKIKEKFSSIYYIVYELIYVPIK